MSRLRLVALLSCLLVLSACRLDVTVDVVMEPDGTGVVTVAAVADAELVERLPDLVDDLRLDDAIANGWQVEGPTLRQDGGADIELTHAFSSAAELANVLTSIGPPLSPMAAARNEGEDGQIVNALNGSLQLAGGYGAFADAELVTAVGGQPFAEEIAEASTPIEQAMSFTYRVALPGRLQTAETGTDVGDGVVEWEAPLDGSSVNVYVETVQLPAGGGNGWAAPLATGAFVALIAWIVVATAFIVVVAFARRSRRRRREQRLRDLGRH